MTAAFSVVIPAHNEGAVIDRLLAGLTAGLEPGEAQIVVVANGCTDDTAERAATWPGVVVVDTPVPSKHAALNLGDARATVFPRLYVDADIRLTGESARSAAATLTTGEALAAAPRIAFDDAGASRGVRLFYRHLRQTPWVTTNLVGLGFYGVSEAGRARWSTFPALIGDDLYVATRFAATERRTTDGQFTVTTPRTVKALVRVRTRIYLGNWEMAGSGLLTDDPARADAAPPEGAAASGAAALKGWALAPGRLAATVYYAVNVVAVVRARLARRSVATTTWHRDETSRR